jgi:cation-transporting P-type ATPase 13A2
MICLFNCMQAMIQIGVQVFSYTMLTQQPFYVRYQVPEEFEDDYNVQLRCSENTTVFTISYLQYLFVALAFSKGAPWRKREWRRAFVIDL